MSQLRGIIIQERKLFISRIRFELDQVDDNNDTHWEEVVANWLMLLRNEWFEEELNWTEIDKTVHPATSQEAKWP
ncbi:19548_t:CDS:2 [Gigaspora margarita]|uniref:19548_t:CDS:1 n=1 Tax=Gigaspora margarita TaxID=4874 RepID=A0ABN7VB69_GIGMA|nr:19548_t:CDS:2 [Gigaspora margarita]